VYGLWWIVLFWLWFLYQGEWNHILIVAAICAATLAALTAVLVRRRARPAFRLEWAWISRTAKVPWLVLRETVQTAWVLVLALPRRRTHFGEFRAFPFPAGGSRPAERGRRALAALAIGFSPNSYVVDIDPETDAMLVHDLDADYAKGRWIV
jgi:multisubunit Na+/H+ antiporter MnhE subunit